MEGDHEAQHMQVVPIGKVWRDLSCHMERMTGCSPYGPNSLGSHPSGPDEAIAHAWASRTWEPLPHPWVRLPLHTDDQVHSWDRHGKALKSVPLMQ